jgi:hypothetical protein
VTGWVRQRWSSFSAQQNVPRDVAGGPLLLAGAGFQRPVKLVFDFDSQRGHFLFTVAENQVARRSAGQLQSGMVSTPSILAGLLLSFMHLTFIRPRSVSKHRRPDRAFQSSSSGGINGVNTAASEGRSLFTVDQTVAMSIRV